MCSGGPAPGPEYAGAVVQCYAVTGPDQGKAEVVARPALMFRDTTMGRPAPYYRHFVHDEIERVLSQCPNARKVTLCADGVPFAGFVRTVQ